MEEKELYIFGLYCLIYIIFVILIYGDEFLVWIFFGVVGGRCW